MIRVALTLMMGLILSSCVPKQEAKLSDSSCGPSKYFDAKTRSCKDIVTSNLPPVNTLSKVTMTEDVSQTVVLTYNSRSNGFAFSCNVFGLSLGLSTASGCVCVGGLCQVTLQPALHYFGMAQFFYTVTDQNGSSNQSLVSVVINSVLHPPIAIKSSPTGIAFPENSSQTYSFSLGSDYTDDQNFKATACDVKLGPTSVTAQISSPCSCNAFGTCFMTLQGVPHQNTYNANATPPGYFSEFFTFRVQAGGLWSDYSPPQYYKITKVNELPIAGTTAVLLSTVNEPIDVTTPWTANISVSYTDYNEDQATTCQASNLVGMTFVSCNCAAPPLTSPVPELRVGTCILTLHMAASQYDANSSFTSFSFNLQFVDGGLAPATVLGPLSQTYTVNVIAGNDTVKITDGDVTGQLFSGTENRVLTVAGSSGTPFLIDEGGAIDEDVQSIKVQVQSENETIVPSSNIKVLWGTTVAQAGSDGWLDLGDGFSDSNSQPISFQLTPVPNMGMAVGTSFNVNVLIKDSLMDDSAAITKTFRVYFAQQAHAPTFRVYKANTFYDAYLKIPGKLGRCDNVLTTVTHEDCTGSQDPISAGIIPDRLGIIYYNYKAGHQWVSTGTTSANDWTIMRTNCPFSPVLAVANSGRKTAEPNCERGTSAYLNCVGGTDPTTAGIQLSNTAATDRYYYDYVAKQCYQSTSANAWVPVTIYDAPSPAMTVTPDFSGDIDPPINTSLPTIAAVADSGKIYQNTSTGQYFSSFFNSTTSIGSWIPFNCNFSTSACAGVNGSTDSRCFRNLPPRKNLNSDNNIIPQSIGQFYFDYNDRVCYRSVGSTSSDDWVISGSDIPDVQTNEHQPVTLSNLLIDEGGDFGQDTSLITMKIRILTNVSSSPDADYHLYEVGNPSLLTFQNIRVYCNGEDVLGSQLDPSLGGTVAIYPLDSTNATHCVGNGLYDLNNIEIRFTPTGNASNTFGRVELEISLEKTATAPAITLPFEFPKKYLSLMVFPISATFADWTAIKAIGHKVDRSDTVLGNGLVVLSWNHFIINGGFDTGDSVSPVQPPVSYLGSIQNNYNAAGISGYNVFRRGATEQYNFARPLNRIPITTDIRRFVDQIGSVTNNAPEGPPKEGSVYFYKVMAIDNINSLVLGNSQKNGEARVVFPPNNMTFVHRWMANKEMCGKMSKTVHTDKNYVCAYSGIGETYPTTPFVENGVTIRSIYDVGYDFLVDTYEAGCPYSSNCSGGDCLDSSVGEPSGAANLHDVFYTRGDSKCHEFNGGWLEFGKVSTAFSATTMNKINRPFLPPLTQIGQSTANALCAGRSNLSLFLQPNLAPTPVTDNSNTTSAIWKLPSRREQMVYSAWDPNIADTDIAEVETGGSLSASEKCNSSIASGLEGNFTDSDTVGSGNFYTLPATTSSITGVRSLITGSTVTGVLTSPFNTKDQGCISYYGVQDFAGNVKEYTDDRIFCLTEGLCFGVSGASYAGTSAPAYTGLSCQYSRGMCSFPTSQMASYSPFYNASDDDELAAGNSDCIGNQGSPNASVVATPLAGLTSVIYYDVKTDNCFTTAGGNTWVVATPTPNAVVPVTLPGKLNIAVGRNDFIVKSDPYYYRWNLDGTRGPCVLDTFGACTLDIIGWLFADRGGNNSGEFVYPMGLVVPEDFKTSYPNSNATKNFVQMSSVQDHGDSITINSQKIAHNNLLTDGTYGIYSTSALGTDMQNYGCGAMVTGGGFRSLSTAGRYTVEFIPCKDANTFTELKDDVGFRCVHPLPVLPTPISN